MRVYVRRYVCKEVNSFHNPAIRGSTWGSDWRDGFECVWINPAKVGEETQDQTEPKRCKSSPNDGDPPKKNKQNLIRLYIEVTDQKKRETSNPTRIVLFLYIWWMFVEACYPWSIWFRKLGPTPNPSSLAWRCVSGSSSQQCRVANNTGQHWGGPGPGGSHNPPLVNDFFGIEWVVLAIQLSDISEYSWSMMLDD